MGNGLADLRTHVRRSLLLPDCEELMAKTKIHQAVLPRSGYYADGETEGPIFSNPSESVRLDKDSWIRMGEPSEITVHVFPGDVSHHFPVPKNA